MIEALELKKITKNHLNFILKPPSLESIMRMEILQNIIFLV